jgi:hypothetical protein
MTAYENLCDMRRAGVRPAKPVHVAFTEPAADGLTLLMREADRKPIDWRYLVSLDVIVWADTATPFDRLMATAWEIAKARPKSFQLCLLHREEWHLIDLGNGTHLPRQSFPGLDLPDLGPLHSFFWFPINMGRTEHGTRLVQAILKTRKRGVTL